MADILVAAGLRYIWNKFSNNYEVPHALSNITRMHSMNVALVALGICD